MMENPLSRALASAVFLVLSDLSLPATAQQPAELKYIDLEFRDREVTLQPRFVKLWGGNVTLADAFANPADYEIDGIGLANKAFGNEDFRKSMVGKTETVGQIIDGILELRSQLKDQTLERLAEIYSGSGIGAAVAYDFLDSFARHYQCLTAEGLPVPGEVNKTFIRQGMRIHINIKRGKGYFDISSTKLFDCQREGKIVHDTVSRRWVVSVRSGLKAHENARYPRDGEFGAYSLSAEGEAIELISLYFDGQLIPDDGSDPRDRFYKASPNSCVAIAFKQKPPPDAVLAADDLPTFCAGKGCNGSDPPGLDATE
jgi:hypothetical protein